MSGLLLAATVAGVCAGTDEIAAKLRGAYREAPAVQGVEVGTGQVMTLWVSDDRATWTITLTDPHGRTCMIAAGKHAESPRSPVGQRS